MRRVLSFLLLVPLFLLCMAVSCDRRCTGPENCSMECECEDGQNVVPCGLNYQCEADGTCSSELGTMDCPTLCRTYPRENLCFSTQCANESECVRNEVCNTVDPMTGQITGEFDCVQNFSCDVELKVCEQGFLLTPTEICQRCADQGIVGQSVRAQARP